MRAPMVLAHFIRRHFSRCALCHSKSEKDKPLISSMMYDERLFHRDCLTAYNEQLHDHDPAKCWVCQHKAIAG